MKILFFIPSLGSGGAERVISNLSNEFVLRDHEVTVALTFRDRRIYPISDKIKVIPIQNYQPGTKTMSEPLRILAIRRIIKENKPDCVISFIVGTNIDVCIASLGLKIPLIISERNDPHNELVGKKIKSLMRRLFYSRADALVLLTEDMKDFYPKKQRERSLIILNPVTTDLPEKYEGEREKKIVSVGRLTKEKNHQMLIDAFALAGLKERGYRLEIYGEGPYEAELKKKIEEKGLEDSVTLMGFSENVYECIKNAAIFVLPSDYEGLPNALLEAMCMGIPSVSTDSPIGGPKTLITNEENGLLVPVGNTEKTAEALLAMVNSPEKAKQMGENAYLLKEKFAVKNIATQWLELIDKIK